jgi:ABC-type polysaccharide/polyol phosphate export permease
MKSFQIQCRVIGALLMREVMTRYGRHNIGFMWLFAEPMLFTLGVTALWSLAGMHHNSSIPIVAFAITGYSSVLLWRNMPNKLACSIEPNLSLMYHRNVKIIDIFLSRLLLEAAGATISFIVLSIIWIALGMMQFPQDVLKVIFGWLMIAWFGSALAIFIGALSTKSDLVDKLWHPTSYLLFPLSGAAYMVDWLPKGAQEAVLWLPMVHGVELLRDGYFGTTVKTHYDISYMATCCLILTVLGLSQVRVASRLITPE